MSGSAANAWFIVMDHGKEARTLRSIVGKYQEWKNALEEGSTEWPNLLAGPWTLGSGIWHKVIMVIEGTDEQVRHLSLNFYKLCDISFDRCFSCMAETPAKLEVCIDKYELG